MGGDFHFAKDAVLSDVEPLGAYQLADVMYFWFAVSLKMFELGVGVGIHI